MQALTEELLDRSLIRPLGVAEPTSFLAITVCTTRVVHDLSGVHNRVKAEIQSFEEEIRTY